MVSKMVLIEEGVEQAPCVLEQADGGVVFVASDGADIWATPLGSDGELVMALLADVDHCEVFAAKLEQLDVVRDAQVVEAKSTLELMVRLRANVPVESVPELDVDPALQAWMVSHLMAESVGSHRAAVLLDERAGGGRRLTSAVKIKGTYVNSFRRYQQMEVQEESLNVWAKIAFTPITLTLDLFLCAFSAWLSSEFDDDEEHSDPSSAFADRSGTVENT